VLVGVGGGGDECKRVSINSVGCAKWRLSTHGNPFVFSLLDTQAKTIDLCNNPKTKEPKLQVIALDMSSYNPHAGSFIHAPLGFRRNEL